jgi:predicted GNAT superfamily acetyltransferase
VAGNADARAVQDLLSEIWSTTEDRPPVSAEMIRALTHAGGYGVRATAGTQTVGATVGLFGHDADGFNLHSYITGVKEGFRGGSVGFALKQHQRAWALARGIRTVTWTFDPLVRRNAYFNLVKLGAEAAAFAPDFYGAMEDGLNAGDESDRIWVEWPLDGPRAVAASRREPQTADLAALEAQGAVRRLRVGTDGGPEADAIRGAVELFQIPEDIVALRAVDPALGLAWRRALRETLGAALADGYRATGITRDGWYVLRRA